MSNVLLGKIGRTINFLSGDPYVSNSPLMLFSAMSRMFPENKYYICGPNNLNKLSEQEYCHLFPNKNLFSIYEKPIKDETWLSWTPITDRIKKENLHFDYALVFNGMNGTTSFKCCGKIADRTTYAKTLDSYGKYQGVYHFVLNTVNCPFYLIAEDGRYILINTRDLSNWERISFTQTSDKTMTPKYARITKMAPLEELEYKLPEIPVKYSHVEKIFLMGVSPKWRTCIDIQRKLQKTKNPKIIVLSNGFRTEKLNNPDSNASRYPELKKYVLDNFKGTSLNNTVIYGKWSKELVEQHPDTFIQKSIVELKEEIFDAKYTFVFSTAPDFVTIKPWEMIIIGLIPFIHPEYDPKRLLGLPEYLYVKDEKDFKEKLLELENDPNKYMQLYDECASYIKPEFLDGSLVVNTIMRSICNDLGWEYQDRPGVSQVWNHFQNKMCNFR